MDVAAPPQGTIALAELGPASFVVSARGALKLQQAQELRDRLFPLVAVGDARIVLDFGTVHSLDPAVVGVVESAAKLIRRGGEGELVIVARDPRVLWLLELTGIDQIARVERDLQDAGGV